MKANVTTKTALSTVPATPEREPRAAGFPLGRIVIGVILAALAAFTGVRIREATRTRAAMAIEREQAAETAKKSGDKQAAPAATIRGAVESWRPPVPLDGTLAPIHEADLGFKAPGRLATIRVREGDRVGQGAVLATLDATEAAAQVAAAAAQVKAAEAQLAIAEDGATRTGTLVARGTASQAAGVQASGQKALASAEVEVARAQLRLAQAALANHTLAAPFSGTVTRVPAGAGAVVSPGVTLFHLQDTSRLKLVATVGENDVALVLAGEAIEVRTGDGRTVAGKVIAVLPSVDPATRRVPVEAEVANDAKAPLLGGIFVHATAWGKAPVPVLRLPSSSLRPGSQDEVMVVAAGRLEARRVVFAAAPDGSLLVRRGLAPGEAVLAAPSAEAKDGQRVDGN